MSASLVGSEMCIRDRTWTERRPATPGWLLRYGSAARESRPVALAEEGSAVSYTHLTLPTICSV
eukprot:6317917-Alexandrium_andersonii.AAC.1